MGFFKRVSTIFKLTKTVVKVHVLTYKIQDYTYTTRIIKTILYPDEWLHASTCMHGNPNNTFIYNSMLCTIQTNNLDSFLWHPMLFHIVSRRRFEVDQKRLQLGGSYELYRLWNHKQEACFPSVDDVSYGVNARAIVVTFIESMFDEFVVLDVSLHLLSTYKQKINTVYLMEMLWTRCVCCVCM